MIGDLTFDKANKNVSLFLYSLIVVDKYGDCGAIRRNFQDGCFIERMGSFIGMSPYKNGTTENRTLYNKSLYTQYYGFLDRFSDDNRKEYVRITPRGKQLLQYIATNEDSETYEDLYCIPLENKRRVQDLLWASVLFDPHGKHNYGAQTSNTDVDPLKVFFKVLFELQKATNEELFYILFSLNRGDKGAANINKTYRELINEVRSNRANGTNDYTQFFSSLGLTNKVGDSKIIDILADPNFDVFVKQEEDGLVYNHISDSFMRFSEQANLLSIAAAPLQYILYGDTVKSTTEWINETLLGRYGDSRRITRTFSAADSEFSHISSFITQARQVPEQDFYCIINADSEDELYSLFADYIPLFTREDNFLSEDFGYSIAAETINNTQRLTPNFHIIALIPMSESISTNSQFDGTFRRIRVEEEIPQPHLNNNPSDNPDKMRPGFNKIFYGAPGTGKSHDIDEKYTKSETCYRITFHPDTDYAAFVGCYKPTMKPNDENPDVKEISYTFVPQVFLKAYVYAWNHPEERTYLVIEELNRGNCAQVFGDIFQLLDRNSKAPYGYSKYCINADSDVADFLKENIGKISVDSEEINDDIVENYKNLLTTIYDLKQFDYSVMAIPSNLYILATMNTSDQSLFPIDSAFKRRWEWQYVKVNYSDAESFTLALDARHHYNWKDVLTGINRYIKTNTLSTNKVIGNRFIQANENGIISSSDFRDKVIFFLFNDVFKDNDDFKADFFGDKADELFFEDLCVNKDVDYTADFLEKICGISRLDIIADETATQNNSEV